MLATQRITPCISIGEESLKEVGPSLLELQVEEDHELAAAFRIKLAIVREEGGFWTFLDNGVAKPWSKVTITMKAGEKEEELITGFVTHVRPHIDADEGKSYLELWGMDATCLMSVEEKVKDWPNKSDSDIAREIFTEYNLTPRVDETVVTHDEAVSTIIQRETDIQFLKRLARGNGFECVVKGDAGFFRKPVLTDPPLPVLAAHFAKETNLTSFDANWNALRPTAVESYQIDAVSKQIQSVTVEASTQKMLGRDGAFSATVPKGRSARAFVKHTVATGVPEMQNLADAVANEADWFIEAKGEVDSIVYGNVLQARKLVPIKGVGELFSGVYYLTSVKHVYTVDRYVQHFTARRNATVPLPSDFSGSDSIF